MGLNVHNDPINREDEEVLVFRLHSSGKAGESLQSPQQVLTVSGQKNGKCCSEEKKGLVKVLSLTLIEGLKETSYLEAPLRRKGNILLQDSLNALEILEKGWENCS